jgi:hypothetical protein
MLLDSLLHFPTPATVALDQPPAATKLKEVQVHLSAEVKQQKQLAVISGKRIACADGRLSECQEQL